MSGAAARPTVVVLRALGLGDLLTGLPAMRALARALPGHRRVLVTSGALAALACQAGAADEVVASSGIAPLPAHLAGADVAVNLHGRGPESSRVLLGCRPRRLVAFAHPEVSESAGGPQWRDEEHEVDRWCRLLSASGMAADAGDLFLDDPGVPVPPWARGATVVHPGAASEARRWPVERFAAVADAERRAGREVVVTGGATERRRARVVAARAGLDPSRVLAGRTDAMELATVVAGAARVVSGDTGVAHLATAVRTPAVVLFGPTPPSRWGPPPGAPAVVLWAGATGDPHAATVDPGLASIGVEEVLDALARLPRRRPPAAPVSAADLPTAPG